MSLRLALLAAVSSLAAAVPAQATRGLGRSGADYFPLQVGAVWEYERTTPGAAPAVVKVACRREIADGGDPYFELRESDGGGTEVQQWRARADGVFQRFSHAYPQAVGRADTDGAWAWASKAPDTRIKDGVTASADLCWLTCPPGLRTEWSLTRSGLEDAAGARARPLPGLRYEASVGSFAEQVTVPAGTFAAIKVVMEVRADDASLRQRVEVWLARDVGPVKRVLSSLEDGRVTVLRSDALTVRSLRAPPPPPMDVARAFVRAHAERWPTEPEVVLLEDRVLTSSMLTRFVLLHAGGTHALLAIDHDGARPFDPARREDVQALADADQIVLGGRDRLLAQDGVIALARACLVLQTVRTRGTPAAPSVEVSQTTVAGGVTPDAWSMQVVVEGGGTSHARLGVVAGRITDLTYVGVTR